MPRKYTEARAQNNKKWDAANLWRISVALPIADKERIRAHAAKLGESVNGYINRLISEDMSRTGQAK